MSLELYSLLSTVIAVATGATVVSAVLAYLLFRMRERKNVAQTLTGPQVTPKRVEVSAVVMESEPEPRFFKRYQPAGEYEFKN